MTSCLNCGYELGEIGYHAVGKDEDGVESFAHDVCPPAVSYTEAELDYLFGGNTGCGGCGHCNACLYGDTPDREYDCDICGEKTPGIGAATFIVCAKCNGGTKPAHAFP